MKILTRVIKCEFLIYRWVNWNLFSHKSGHPYQDFKPLKATQKSEENSDLDTVAVVKFVPYFPEGILPILNKYLHYGDFKSDSTEKNEKKNSEKSSKIAKFLK